MDAKTLFDLSEKVAIVAGGSRGIGFAIAEGLASVGASIVVANSTPETGERAAAAIRTQGYEARAVPLDLRDRGSIEQMVSATSRPLAGSTSSSTRWGSFDADRSRRFPRRTGTP